MAKTLTKAGMVDHIYKRVGLTKREGGDLVDEIFQIMKDELAAGRKVRISGFGNFVVEDKAARKGRNPRTGESIIIARHRVVKLRYSKKLRDLLNEDK